MWRWHPKPAGIPCNVTFRRLGYCDRYIRNRQYFLKISTDYLLRSFVYECGVTYSREIMGEVYELEMVPLLRHFQCFGEAGKLPVPVDYYNRIASRE